MSDMQFNWPGFSCVGLSGVRYFSIMNPWIDFVVLFDDSQYTSGTISGAIHDSMALFWEGDTYECYGDALYDNMRNEWGVQHFMILFHDSENESEEYEEAWEKWLGHIEMRDTIREAE